MSIHLCHLGADDGRECAHCGIALYADQFGCNDKSRCMTWQRARAEKAEQALADVVKKATPYGTQDGDFIASYILPTGPIHRAIPLLAERGIHVRPVDTSADHDDTQEDR